jgi:gamma-glutamyltranspeptidase/glutathione hydrolase
MRRCLALIALVAVAVATAAGTAGAKQGSRFRAPVSGRLGVIATESPAAAAVGRRVLERGGNAVDAAVATVFALNVARPQSCGIGGGGFLVYRSPRGRTAALDFRETAPAAFNPQILVPKDLTETFTGHLTVGVPGTLAGMRAALRRYGTLNLSSAIAPAERLARHGVRVTPALATAMQTNAERLKLYPAAARQFLRRGRPYAAGSLLRQPTLARTLRRIRRGGTKSFYRGAIARRIVADMRHGHKPKGDRAVLTARDLARYRAKWRAPLIGSFRGRRVIAMPPPTSGGIAVLEMLNILAGYNLKAMGQSSADAFHRIIEAQKLAFADRGQYVADPDKVHVPTATLISKGYAAQRRALIDPNRAGSYQPGLGSGSSSAEAAPRREESTTHISVVDRRGGAVALTCTIEQEFGSAVVAPGTGFLLNNEMTDFGAPGSANEARAGKRPRSSMSPLIVAEKGRPIDVTGGAGGSRIIMGTFFSVLNRVEYGLDLAHAVDAERLDAQLAPKDRIELENARVDPAVLANLLSRGHSFKLLGEYGPAPRVQAAGYRSAGGGAVKDAVSDSRTERGSLAQRR